MIGLVYSDLQTPSIKSETIQPKLIDAWGPYSISDKLPAFNVKAAIGVLEQTFVCQNSVFMYGAMQNQQLTAMYSSIPAVPPTAPVSSSELFAEIFADCMADTGTSVTA